ncbi:YajD family HNH nuclease [uncultured Desulfuromusa sp.]|uniref:YajD family HNH nuclease n=1 Tax=uncultured Desulfuromusa sp. TaxID=219183 RepID=UPI002AA95D9C|nr:YajD family HNH nuclease [uncultured Desulfuromusa sp.]
MTSNKNRLCETKRNQLISKMRQEEQQRQSGYREQALKLFPHVCGRCGRDFEGKKVRELTVHHKDHNHDNNPPNGSNWELLCIYCHEHEHTRGVQEARLEGTANQSDQLESLSYSPFAALAKKIEEKK